MLGDSIRRRRPARKAPGGKGRDGGPRRGSLGSDRYGWLRWIGVAVIVLLASFGGGYILATVFVFPPPETAGVGVPVPALYGLEWAAAEHRLRELGLRVGTVTEVASNRAAAGRVIAQEPVAEQELRPGASVSLAVSAGAPVVRVPPVTGLAAATARDLLETAGFEVAVQTVRTSGLRDAVIRTEPEAATVVQLPAAVTLIVNLGPEEPEEVEPADSPATAPADPIWP